jgi:hypothetical protein
MPPLSVGDEREQASRERDGRCDFSKLLSVKRRESGNCTGMRDDEVDWMC